MNSIYKLSLAFLYISTTSACSNVGRPAFVSDTGVSQEVIDSTGQAPLGDGLLYQFKLAAVAARPYAGNPPVLVDNAPAKQRAFMSAGFALISARCNQYILSKSDNQRKVNVWRDTFAPITALLTGAVALIGTGDSTDNDALTALALGISATTAGFKIYEERYLFGAENVNSVRRLILKALADNSEEASKTADVKMNYSQAVTHLINNQSVCSPGHILELVSQAIDQGKVKSTKSDGNNTESKASSDEQDAVQATALIEHLETGKLLTDRAIDAADAPIAERAPPPTPVVAGGLEIITTRVSND